MNYLGHLPPHDPLYGYLRREIMPQVEADGRNGFRVFGVPSSNSVYIYEDRATGRRVVGKFFRTPARPDFERGRRKLNREYECIREFRKYLGPDHYAARALGRSEALNCLLTVEYCHGETLDSVVLRSIRGRDDRTLFGKLTALARFLVEVHNRSARPVMVDFQRVCRYFDGLVSQLGPVTDGRGKERLRQLGDRYRGDPVMYQDQEVLVHGDATPANFMFGDGMYVITFDLERSQRTDRVFDVGRLVGELQHFFLRETGDRAGAEPFIGHFLWEYAGGFPDRERAFRSVAARVPFYAGMTLLRIARNHYLPLEYRRALVAEAERELAR